MLQHIDAVRHRDAERAARHALADDGGDERHLQRQALFGRARDGFGLPAFFGAEPGIGAGRIGEGQHRQTETVGQIEEPDGLAIALGHRHAEIVFEAALGVVALFMAEQRDRLPAETAEPGHDRLILAKQPVAGERGEIVDQAGNVIGEMRPRRMAGDHRLLPWRELGIGLADQLVGLGLKARDVVRPRPASPRPRPGRVLRGKLAQFHDFSFEFGNRTFEFEIGVHRCSGMAYANDLGQGRESGGK